MLEARYSPLPDLDVEHAHDAIERAIEAASVDGLNVVGFGEMTLAVAWPAAEPRAVVKRLPRFPSRAHLDRYGVLLGEYLSALDERGVPHLPTALRSVPGPGATVHGYLVQPVVEESGLASEQVRHGSEEEAGEILARVVAHVLAAVDGSVGLDAQLPNWACLDGRLATLDVSTPFMRDANGRERLELSLFRGAYPAIAWSPLGRWVTPGVLDTYYDPRSVLRDVGANMLRQRLDARLPRLLELVNARLEAPISEAEVRHYFKRDARTWALLQHLRRLDRWWQRRIRRRPYPFLLPPRYDSRSDYAGTLRRSA